MAVDMFTVGTCKYLCWIDRYSGFSWLHKFLKDPNTSKVVTVLRDAFLQSGFPHRIRADSGPQFRTEFNLFCSNNKIIRETSAPYCPQSNGLAESGLKQIKNLILKCQETKQSFEESYAALRNCPRTCDGLSSSELFFNRQLRYPGLPQLPRDIDFRAAGLKRQNDKEGEKVKVNDRKSQRYLEPLKVGDQVLIQNEKSRKWSIQGTVARFSETKRLYYILDENNKTSHRNRKHLKLLIPKKHMVKIVSTQAVYKLKSCLKNVQSKERKMVRFQEKCSKTKCLGHITSKNITLSKCKQ
jgi:hypothetical protein